jgi:Ni,Fe-hydrogenase I cytochrome b subunit
MTATWLALAFEDVEWLRPFHNAAKHIPSAVQWGMYGFIIIHLTGVIRADLTKYGVIVSRMINGKTPQ